MHSNEKEDLLNDDFIEQIKSVEELSDILKQIPKLGIEKMLEGELDGQFIEDIRPIFEFL